LNSAYVTRIGDNDLTTENEKADPFVCIQHLSLAAQLQKIIDQWEKTWSGWKAKHDLLELIWGLLTKKGGKKEESGLHCGDSDSKQSEDAKKLCNMLTGLRKTSETERAMLEKEKKTLDGHKKNLDNYKCDCTFTKWDGDFGQCQGGSGETAVKNVDIYMGCNEQQEFPLGEKNCKATPSQCGEGTKMKKRKLLWNRKPGDTNEPGLECPVGQTAEGVLSAVDANKVQTLTAECKAGEFQGKCPINCEWAPWSDGGVVANAACPADSCSVKDAKQTITRKKKTVRANGGKYCFQDEKGHFNEVSEACSYETTVSMEKAKMSSDKAKAEALAKELKKEMCKDGAGPCRNDATCDVQLNEDNTKVTSWCKCKAGFTGDFCEKAANDNGWRGPDEEKCDAYCNLAISKTATCEDMANTLNTCMSQALAAFKVVRPRMKRGPNWRFGAQDGNGEGETFGVVDMAASALMVNWDKTGNAHRYIMKNNDCQVRPVIGQGKICLKTSKKEESSGGGASGLDLGGLDLGGLGR